MKLIWVDFETFALVTDGHTTIRAKTLSDIFPSLLESGIDFEDLKVAAFELERAHDNVAHFSLDGRFLSTEYDPKFDGSLAQA